MKLTYHKLKLAGACEDQAKLFKQLFPKGVEVTEAVCVSVADKFDWDWAVEHLLPRPVWAEYERQYAPVWAEYDRQYAPVWAEYDRQRATLRAKYERQYALVWAEYERQRAMLFGRLMETVE